MYVSVRGYSLQQQVCLMYLSDHQLVKVSSALFRNTDQISSHSLLTQFFKHLLLPIFTIYMYVSVRGYSLQQQVCLMYLSDHQLVKVSSALFRNTDQISSQSVNSILQAPVATTPMSWTCICYSQSVKSAIS